MRRERAEIPGLPTPGYYLLRLVRDGWAVPCQVIGEAGLYRCVVDGEELAGTWTHEALLEFWAQWLTAESTHPLVQVQLHGEPCDEAAYRHRLALKDWATRNDPNHPSLHPRRPMVTRFLTPTEF